jgi:K319-like protein/uncharacterized protein DUF1565
MKKSFILFLITFAILVTSNLVCAKVWYVKIDGSDTKSGSNWDEAFLTIKQAIYVANPEDEVWVKKGTYVPGLTRSSSFSLKHYVAIYGGFDGTETSIDQRNWSRNLTILSGDINGDDDGFYNMQENVYHVLLGGNNSILDGFTITGGNANVVGRTGCGGGMRNDYSPIVRNCIFLRNKTTGDGGAVWNNAGCTATFINCVFRNNKSESGYYEYRGGGAVYNYSTWGSEYVKTFINCLFVSNIANGLGGAMVNQWSNTVITNCTFVNNTAKSGGAIANITNHNGHSRSEITNTICWNNNAVSGKEIWYNNFSSAPILSFNDIEGCGGSGVNWNVNIGIDAGSNIDINPLLVDLNGGDFHLTSISPCIDSGTFIVSSLPTIDYDGDDRIIGNAPDIGADEFVDNISPISDAGNDQYIHISNTVTLDGSASIDPDENYPLTYSWEFLVKPNGSTAVISDPNSIYPSFIADSYGDYIVRLVITDSLGFSSGPDQVLISTYNTPPVADAGEDQAIQTIGTVVQLSDSQSYDDEGDAITYSWTMTVKPEGSSATLSDPSSIEPTFIADKNGDYVIELIVSDNWDASIPDTVAISFSNIPPVADAGDNKTIVIGDTVHLDGSNSSDVNLDPLNFTWSIVSKPDGSSTVIVDNTSIQTSFLPDMAGEYVISLVVNDGLVDSDPDDITVMVLSKQDITTETLIETIDIINDPLILPDEVLKNDNLRNTLTKKINAVLGLIDQGLYADALDKLQNDILGKTNGCAEIGSPDKNDWIKDCEAQEQVYPMIVAAIEHLQGLIE